MGALEVWKDIPGYEGVYRASNLGRIESVERKVFVARKNGSAFYNTIKGRIMSQYPDRYGYLTASIFTKPKAVHQLVMRAFVGPLPEGMQVAHGNGDRKDNRLENLRYATAKENISDRDMHGTTARGDTHGRSKVKESDWPQIVALRGVVSQEEVARQFGVSQARVSKIQRTKGIDA
jgi:HNH endonuclease/NUMOD4 motif